MEINILSNIELFLMAIRYNDLITINRLLNSCELLKYLNSTKNSEVTINRQIYDNFIFKPTINSLKCLNLILETGYIFPETYLKSLADVLGKCERNPFFRSRSNILNQDDYKINYFLKLQVIGTFYNDNLKYTKAILEEESLLQEYNYSIIFESNRLKNIVMCSKSNKTLFDIFQLNRSDLVILLKNDIFRNLFNKYHNDFSSVYKNFGNMMNYIMIKTNYRKALLNDSESVLTQLCEISIMEEIHRDIFKYLSNSDLETLNLCPNFIETHSNNIY